MDMLEQLARGIYEADTGRSDWDDPDDTVYDFGPREKEHYRSVARHALTVLREPTERMSVAGCPHPDNGGAPYCYDRDVINDAYRAMIDAVLTG